MVKSKSHEVKQCVRSEMQRYPKLGAGQLLKQYVGRNHSASRLVHIEGTGGTLQRTQKSSYQQANPMYVQGTDCSILAAVPHRRTQVWSWRGEEETFPGLPSFLEFIFVLLGCFLGDCEFRFVFLKNVFTRKFMIYCRFVFQKKLYYQKILLSLFGAFCSSRAKRKWLKIVSLY